MSRILCSICGAGPSLEDGAATLFASRYDAEGPTRFCAECLPLPAARARLERHLKVGPLLEPVVVNIITQRLAEVRQ